MTESENTQDAVVSTQEEVSNGSANESTAEATTEVVSVPMVDEAYLKSKKYSFVAEEYKKALTDGTFTVKQFESLEASEEIHNQEDKELENKRIKEVSLKYNEEYKGKVKKTLEKKYGEEKGTKIWNKYKNDSDFLEFAEVTSPTVLAKGIIKHTDTKESYMSKINELEKHPAYRNGGHIEHWDIIEKINKLYLDKNQLNNR